MVAAVGPSQEGTLDGGEGVDGKGKVRVTIASSLYSHFFVPSEDRAFPGCPRGVPRGRGVRSNALPAVSALVVQVLQRDRGGK